MVVSTSRQDLNSALDTHKFLKTTAVTMDHSYLGPFQPFQYPITPDLSYGGSPIFSEFEILPLPSQLGTPPEQSFFDQQPFDPTELPFELTTPTLLSQDLLHTQKEQDPASQTTVHPSIESSQRARSTSLDLDFPSPNPLQDRRKAQNRAAQRAFRVRRQLQSRDLQAKIMLLEKQVISMTDEHARLKKQLAHTTATNMILQARLRVHAIGRKVPGLDRQRERSPIQAMNKTKIPHDRA